MKSGLGLHKIFNYISRKLSLIIFNQRLPLGYIMFNTIYKKYIVNKKIEDDEILKFHNSGVVKLNINLKNEIEEYKDKLFIKEEDKEDTSKRVKFSLNNQDKKDFVKKVKKKTYSTNL